MLLKVPKPNNCSSNSEPSDNVDETHMRKFVAPGKFNEVLWNPSLGSSKLINEDIKESVKPQNLGFSSFFKQQN